MSGEERKEMKILFTPDLPSKIGSDTRSLVCGAPIHGHMN